MEQTPTEVHNLSPFANVLRLYSTQEAVIEHDVTKLNESGKPIAIIKPVHSGANAAEAPGNDAGGLEATVCLDQSARVMLTSNL